VVWASRDGGYGNLVAIDHGNGFMTRYAHNKKILVEAGDRVEKGEPIAHMGSTGHSTGTHVHFEVLRFGNKVNPETFIRKAG
jgi:murein DD-endopeptidase MepM/ murein hydrolase activator NlpD